MSRCKQCGAMLPENSTVCLHCNTDNAAQQARSVEFATPPPPELDFLKPAFTGGVALGVLSGIPLISCFCCIWVLGGGALATWQLDKQRPGTLKYGDGAIAGGLAGLIGGIVATIVGLPLQRLLMTPERVIGWMERFMPDIPPEARTGIMENFGPLDISRVLIQTVTNLVLLGVFALIGGCLMVAILNRKKTD
jgi:hypothetical protein